MSGQSILLVEDEKNLRETLQEYLSSKGHLCRPAANASQAREVFLQARPDVVLMDIGLPDGNGLELARELRQKRQDFVLLFLSAQNDPDTRLEGLMVGAEDYITKPFALKELLLRLERILGQQQRFREEPEVLMHGPLKIWFSRYEVEGAGGERVQLSQKECAILEFLYKRQGNVVARDEIIAGIWGEDAFPSTRTVDNYIVRLRKWCETDPERHVDIMSVRGAGYKLVTKD